MKTPQGWLFTPERVAIHTPTGTAVLADLHLGYDETRCRGGDALPFVSLEEVLQPLGEVCSRHAVSRLIVAGDLLESALPAGLARRLTKVLHSFNLELSGIVPGNHDRRLETAGLPLFPNGIQLDDWLIVHGDGTLPAGKIAQGHHHPCLRLSAGQSAPCYLVSESRIVLPAFSSDAAGSNVLSRLEWNDYRCHAIAGDEVLDFGTLRQLRKRLGLRCRS
jgi:putative SbcD/Mre11-related phosphoesterase